MSDGPEDPESAYGLVLTPPASRAIASALPEPVAAAVIEFLTDVLLENPRRVGKALRRELAGIHSARRGTYRVNWTVNMGGRRFNKSASFRL